MSKVNLKELEADEVSEFLAQLGLPAYRAGQLISWMYEKRAESLSEITEFSKPLRLKLSEVAYIGGLELKGRLVSVDGTEKYAFALEDGNIIECVLIPGHKRLTLCISSQAGCAMRCKFCLTGQSGLRRNLKAHEIVEQVLASGRLASPRRISNIVLMGMGEPLHNLHETARALWRMKDFLKISPRKITVSTSGLANEMLALSKLAPPVTLAVSLNATTDEVRSAIMPINHRYPIKTLLAACRSYPLSNRDRITFEYVMFQGINDSPDDAARLVGLLRGIRSKVNLIPFNEAEGLEYRAPGDEAVAIFRKALEDGGVTAMVRKSMGRDILAACGQLSGAVKPHFS